MTPRSSIGYIERYLLRCRSFPIWRNSVLSGFSFSLLVDMHDWTEAKHDCKPFSAAAESPDAKVTYSWRHQHRGSECSKIILLSGVV